MAKTKVPAGVSWVWPSRWPVPTLYSCYELKPARRKNSAGVLLVEALVSFSLFLLVSLFFYGMMANSRRAETKARETHLATAYARELLEQRIRRGFSALAIGTETGSAGLATSRAGVKGMSNLRFRVVTRGGPNTNTRSLLVSVLWHDGEVEMEAYVTK